MAKKTTTAERIRKANKRFAAMTKAQKRVAIAKDVLAALATKKIEAESGTYYLRTKALGDKLNGEQCNACAIGALFACQVERTPKLKLTDASDYYDSTDVYWDEDAHEYKEGAAERSFASYGMRETLRKFFGDKQLGLIETAFEQDDDYCYDLNLDGDTVDAAIKFGSRYRSDRGRMRAIMENIVANRGEFRP